LGGACGAYGGGERLMQGFGGKPEGKRPRHRLEDNVKKDLQKVGWSGLIWPRIETGGGHL